MMPPAVGVEIVFFSIGRTSQGKLESVPSILEHGGPCCGRHSGRPTAAWLRTRSVR